ncbi:MAG: double-strand break repair helicase AddA [Candidatus Pacebacteria bacterium]|nr:double-strand break repair helicase AddA [Candidatus Paceibacterota bacterium]
MSDALDKQPGQIQGRASDPHSSAWVSASAGSGKTKVLTDRVLRLLLTGVQPQRIVCLTYTKIAAAEMLERVMTRLRDWSDWDEAKLKININELIGVEAEQAILLRGKRLYGQLLNAASGLKIQTIHSFCESLLGRFPLESNIPPSFQILDELTASLLLNRAKRDLISQIETSPNHPLKPDLARLIISLGEWGFSFDNRNSPFKQFFDYREEYFTLVEGGDLEASRLNLAAELEIDPSDSVDSLKRQAMSETHFPAQQLRKILPILEFGTPILDQGLRQELIAILEQTPQETMGSYDLYAAALLTQKGEPKKKVPTKKLSESYPKMAEFLEFEKQRLVALNQKLARLESYHNSVAIMRIGGEILQSYHRLKQQQLRLDFDDLILATRKLLERDNGVSWVMYKLDAGIDHLLVDEAQDSNPSQWAIIAKLVESFFTSIDTSDPSRKNRSIFVVGDRKQSIYSFQGAEVAAFDSTESEFKRLAADYQIPWVSKSFDFSFRSTPPILQAVDRVFNGLTAPNGVLLADQTLLHRSQRKSPDGEAITAGRVELWPLITVEPSPELQALEMPPERRSKIRADTILARLLVMRIKSWLDQKTILPTKGRPIRAGDIMILVRHRSRLDRIILRELKQAGIAVAGADRQELAVVLAVQDLLALMQFVVLPSDDLTLAALLKSPLVGVSEEGLFDLAYDRAKGQSLWDSLRQKQDSRREFALASERLSGWLARADFVPPLEFLSECLSKGEGRKRLLARLGTEMEEPIDALLQLVQSYEETETPTLQGFLSWFAAGSSQIVRKNDSQRDEIRIMTVHGAKGLQAPIVILPDTTSLPQNRKSLFWHPRFGALFSPSAGADSQAVSQLRAKHIELQAEEYQRLLYVALTRAEEWLIICGHQGGRKSDNNWYDLMQKSWFDLGAEWSFADDPALAAAARELAPTETSGRVYQVLAPLPETAAPQIKTDAPAEPLPRWIDRPPPEVVKSLFPDSLRPSWEEVIASPPHSAATILATSREPLSRPLGGRQRGIIVHSILQYLPARPRDQWPSLTQDYLAQPRHGLPLDEQASLHRQIIAILNEPKFAEVFAAEGLAEVPITGRIGDWQVNGRIDRLVVTTEEVLLVDYKTDRQPAQNLQQVNPAYLRQMAAYRAVIAKLYPTHRIRCGFLWTETPEWLEIPNEALHSFLP